MDKGIKDPPIFCFPRPREGQTGRVRAPHPVDAAIEYFHENTQLTWKHTQDKFWSIRFKCWSSNGKKVSDFAFRLISLSAMNEEKERGLTSIEFGIAFF